eukprot:gb/GECH01013585.1/.p1 GENE.gb/GECH01013585.1/~~gb/GECH01013585.1/.p1  ORF type:complete len:134 (+),score=24.76 gb/GECH01013585.1/:1-402(+)
MTNVIDEYEMEEAQEPKIGNTYKLEPNVKFSPPDVQKIMYEELHNNLKDQEYKSENAPQLCNQTTKSIYSKLKELGYDQYKIIVQVLIFEPHGQGIRVGSRSLWDYHHDNWASASFKSSTIRGVSMAFGLYYE